MRFALLADFWPWYDGLSNGEKIAFWTLWATIGAAIVAAMVGYSIAKYAAKAGAKAAFDMERSQDREELRDRYFSALNYAHYVLSMHRNYLAIFRDLYFNVELEEPGTYSLPHMSFPDNNETLNIASLSFLADSVPMALREIEIVEQRYSATFDQFRVFRKLTDRYRGGERGQDLQNSIHLEVKSIMKSLEHTLRLFESAIPNIDKLRRENFKDKEIHSLNPYEPKRQASQHQQPEA